MDWGRYWPLQSRRELLGTTGLQQRLDSPEIDTSIFRVLYAVMRAAVLGSLVARLLLTAGEAQPATYEAFKWLALVYGVYLFATFTISCLPLRRLRPTPVSHDDRLISVPPSVYILIDTAFAALACLLAGDPESDLFILLALPVLIAAEQLRRRQVLLTLVSVALVLMVCVLLTSADKALFVAHQSDLANQPVWLMRALTGRPYASLHALFGEAGARSLALSALLRVFAMRAGLLLVIGVVAALRTREERTNRMVMAGLWKALPEPCFAISLDTGLITACSDLALHLPGGKLAAGRWCWRDLLGHSSREECQQGPECLCRQMRTALNRGRYQGRLRVRAGDRMLECSLALLRVGNEPVAGIVVARDITLQSDFEACLSRAIDSAEDTDQVLVPGAEKIQQAGFDRVRIYQYDERKGVFVGAASAGMGDVAFRGYVLERDDPYTAATLAGTAPFAVHQVTAADPCLHHLLKEGAPDWVDIPLSDGETLHGKVSADNAISHRNVDPGAVEMAVELSHQVTDALRNTRTLVDAAEQIRRLSSLLDLARSVEFETSEDRVIGLILTALTAKGGLEFNRAAWLSRRHRLLVCEHALGSLTAEEHKQVMVRLKDLDLRGSLEALARGGAESDEALLNHCRQHEVSLAAPEAQECLAVPAYVPAEACGVLGELRQVLGGPEAAILPIRGAHDLAGVIVADTAFSPGRAKLPQAALQLFCGVASAMLAGVRTKAGQQTLLDFAAHDFTTPTTIAEQALDDFLEDDLAHDPLDKLSRCLSRLHLAAHNLRRLNIWEQQGLWVQRACLDLRHELDEAIQMLAPIALQCGRRFDPLPPPGLWVSMQHEMLESVLTNLLHNAAKWADPDTAIAVTCSAEGLQSGYLTLTLENRGTPISSAVAEAANKGRALPTNRDYDDERVGAGLGLRVVRDFVRACDGQFAVYPLQGGTGVSVTLPLAEDPPGGARPDADATSA